MFCIKWKWPSFEQDHYHKNHSHSINELTMLSRMNRILEYFHHKIRVINRFYRKFHTKSIESFHPILPMILQSGYPLNSTHIMCLYSITFGRRPFWMMWSETKQKKSRNHCWKCCNESKRALWSTIKCISDACETKVTSKNQFQRCRSASRFFCFLFLAPSAADVCVYVLCSTLYPSIVSWRKW